MSKILITGAAGYIGSVLTRDLLDDGHEVIAIDNFMYGQTSLTDCCHYQTFTIVHGDARNRDLIERLIQDVDVIIPLACLVGMPACIKDAHAAETTNLGAIELVLELRSPNQKILFPNTNSGYGIGYGELYCDERTPMHPISLYGRTKVAAEKAILDAGNAIVFRLATVFGVSPRMRLDLLVNDFVYRAVNDRFIVLFEPHFKRNYIHIRDVVAAFKYAINNFEIMKNEPYNLGLSNANLSKRELCDEIKKQLPDFTALEADIGEDPDKRNYVVSNEKIEKMGFYPTVSLQDGITELIKGFQIVRRGQYSNV